MKKIRFISFILLVALLVTTNQGYTSYASEKPIKNKSNSYGTLNKKNIRHVSSESAFIKDLKKLIKSGKAKDNAFYYDYVPKGNIKDKIRASILGKNEACYELYNVMDITVGYYRGYTTTGEYVNLKKVRVYFNTTTNQDKKTLAKADSLIKKYKVNKMSTYNKVKWAYDYLVKNVTYDESYVNNTAYTALIKKSSICEGYSYAFQLLMDKVSVPCCIVTNSNHMWNSVKISGKWYNLDTTWGDTGKYTKYLYFLQNNDFFKPSHENKSYCTASRPYSLNGYKYKYVYTGKDRKKYHILVMNSKNKMEAKIQIDLTYDLPVVYCYTTKKSNIEIENVDNEQQEEKENTSDAKDTEVVPSASSSKSSKSKEPERQKIEKTSPTETPKFSEKPAKTLEPTLKPASAPATASVSKPTQKPVVEPAVTQSPAPDSDVTEKTQNRTILAEETDEPYITGPANDSRIREDRFGYNTTFNDIFSGNFRKKVIYPYSLIIILFSFAVMHAKTRRKK